MIGPDIEDVENATDEEIIAAYVGMELFGPEFTESDARAYLFQLRNNDPRFLTD